MVDASPISVATGIELAHEVPARGRVFYFTRARYGYTLMHWFDPAPEPEDPEVIHVPYERLSHVATALPEGTYVFTDTDRLDAALMRAAVKLAWRVAGAGARHRVANWPNLVKNRLELLTHLRRTGQNGFSCWRLIEHRKVERFPVFLRLDGRHGGAVSDLLHDERALRGTVAALLDAGATREELLVVEYQETDRYQGWFLGYSAFCAYGDVWPSEITATANWMANAARRAPESDVAALEQDWIRTLPEADVIARTFRQAGIDWGRIDYGFSEGRLQVFEINTNPDLCSHPTWTSPTRRPHWLAQELPAIRACFRRLAAPGEEAGRPWRSARPAAALREPRPVREST